mgnify:CR=1 FL=1
MNGFNVALEFVKLIVKSAGVGVTTGPVVVVVVIGAWVVGAGGGISPSGFIQAVKSQMSNGKTQVFVLLTALLKSKHL